jgi:hypothetical protein
MAKKKVLKRLLHADGAMGVKRIELRYNNAGTITGEFPVNHYRRMKRMLPKFKGNATAVIQAYRKAAGLDKPKAIVEPKNLPLNE